MSVFDWDLNPDNNQKSDPDINWREGQPPSSVNNSARAMMSAFAAWLVDTSGPVAAAGTANALIINLTKAPAAPVPGLFGFQVSQANTGDVTVAFTQKDGTTSPAFPLRERIGVAIPANTLLPNRTYLASFLNGRVMLINSGLTTAEFQNSISSAVATSEQYADSKDNQVRSDAANDAQNRANNAQNAAQSYADSKDAQVRSDAATDAQNRANGAQANAQNYTNVNAWMRSQHGWPVESLRRTDAGAVGPTPPTSQRSNVPAGAFVTGFQADQYGGSNFSDFYLFAQYLQYFRQDVGWVTVGG